MATNVAKLRGLVEAYLSSLQNLSPKEREKNVSGGFADNFNNILDLAKDAASPAVRLRKEGDQGNASRGGERGQQAGPRGARESVAGQSVGAVVRRSDLR